MYKILSNNKLFTAGQAAIISDLPYHCLNRWAKTGLLIPSVQQSSGVDSLRIYSFNDVLALKAASSLRAMGLDSKSLKDPIVFLQKKKFKEIEEGQYLSGNPCKVTNLIEFEYSIKSIEFAWIIDLTKIIKEVDTLALQKINATRGRASLVDQAT